VGVRFENGAPYYFDKKQATGRAAPRDPSPNDDDVCATDFFPFLSPFTTRTSSIAFRMNIANEDSLIYFFLF
jgi:hypothetical protein